MIILRNELIIQLFLIYSITVQTTDDSAYNQWKQQTNTKHSNKRQNKNMSIETNQQVFYFYFRINFCEIR